MAADSDATSDTNNAVPTTVLYQHTKRPEWGLAILAWERESLRAFQFEDGKLRVFKQGYYELVQEVSTYSERAEETAAELERKLGAPRATSLQSAATANGDPVIQFEEQLRIFAIEYPEGFQDPEWARGKRGEGVPRRLKRHRDAAIVEAQRSLAKDRITNLIAAENYHDVVDDAVAILDSTDLVARKQVQLISDLLPALKRGFALALADLLYGDEPYQLRFERFLAPLARSRRGAATWQLTTALPSLVLPNEHICIRPASMRKQAAQMFADFVYTNTPNGPLYHRFLELAGKVRDALEAAGLAPRDLLDVHDFVAETTRPSAKRLLEH